MYDKMHLCILICTKLLSMSPILLKDGCTALYIAARYGKRECVVALLSAGADINMQTKVSILIIANLSSYANKCIFTWYKYTNTTNKRIRQYCYILYMHV